MDNDKQEIAMRLTIIALLCLLLVPQIGLQGAEGSGGCLKQVFGEYCLGGSLRQLVQQRPYGIPARQNGERSAVVYPQGREHTYVMAFQGRIYKVLHSYEPANQLKLNELKERLEAKYGAYRDLSQYPAYVRNQASKVGAIRRGEGELRLRWTNAAEGWSVELAWTRKLGISLAYVANELDSKQQAVLDERL